METGVEEVTARTQINPATLHHKDLADPKDPVDPVNQDPKNLKNPRTSRTPRIHWTR